MVHAVQYRAMQKRSAKQTMTVMYLYSGQCEPLTLMITSKEHSPPL